MGGGGSSESVTKTDASTKIVTETNTTVGDIGLTGSDAVALAQVIQSGATAQVKEAGAALIPVADAFTEGFRTIGGQVRQDPPQKTTKDLITDNAPLIVAALAATAFIFAANR